MAGQYESRCPAHDDRAPSLGIAVGDQGDCVVHCQAGCTTDEIVAAIGLTVADLFLKRSDSPPPAAPENHPHHETPENPIHPPPHPPPTVQNPPLLLAPAKSIQPSSERSRSRGGAFLRSWRCPKRRSCSLASGIISTPPGRVAASVIRFDLPKGANEDKAPKQFVPLHPNGGGWSIGDPPRWPLYQLPDIEQAIKEKKRVFFVEGEKTADALRKYGLTATTTAHGAKSPKGTDFIPLTGVDEVIALADNDDAGREFIKIVTGIILTVAPLAIVRSPELPGLPPKGDFVDWELARADYTKEELLAELEGVIAPAPTTRSGNL